MLFADIIQVFSRQQQQPRYTQLSSSQDKLLHVYPVTDIHDYIFENENTIKWNRKFFHLKYVQSNCYFSVLISDAK